MIYKLTQQTYILVALLLINSIIYAQLKNDFTPRFSQSVKGDMTMIANNMLSRDAIANYNGPDDNHDFSDNVFVDIDNDNTTFNSSNAVFNNPKPAETCLNIKKVYLYWAAADYEEDNPNNEPNWNYDQVKFMIPGSSGYTTITADEVLYRGRDDNGDGTPDDHFSNDPYICFKDITDAVKLLASPYGTYQVANVRAKKGDLFGHDGHTGTSGGWQIVFIYENDTLPAKNITIFDGYAHVTRNNNGFDININGFQTIPNGPVNANILIGSLEGDRDLFQDRLQILDTNSNWIDLSTNLRSADNFFNSKITLNGSDFIDRNPASTNTLGFDAAIFQLNNPNNDIINNSQTNTTIRLTSDQETYGLYLLGFAIEVYEPNLSPLNLFTNVSGGGSANASDIVDFSVSMQNTGNDDIINLQISTIIPNQVSLVEPILGLPAGVTYTYNTTTSQLIFYVQDGLTNVGSPVYSIDYQVQVNNHCYFLETECATSFSVQMIATYNGVINGDSVTTLSSSGLDKCGIGNQLPNKTIINQPPLVDWLTAANALDTIIECDNTQAITDAQNLAPILEDCNLILVKTSGSFIPDNTNCTTEGTYTNTWNYSDICGRSGASYTQVITIQDTTAPAFIESLPVNLIVECENVPTPAVLTGTDTCDNNVQITFNETITNQDATCDFEYDIERVWTATDCAGNSITHTQLINVNDSPPTFDPASLPNATVNVECDTDIPDAATITLVASDNCSAVTDIVITANDVISGQSGVCDGSYTVTRTWTATDCNNNTFDFVQLST